MPNSPSKRSSKIMILSGSTGRTADQLLHAALGQFPGCDVDVIYETRIRTVNRAIDVVARASAQDAVICHSLVAPKIRQAVMTEVRRLGVPCIDVLGPALSLLGDHLHSVPRGRAGLLHEIRREQLDRIEAVDFTLAHDDGKHLSGLKEADVVLVGASRTSKSVTCFFLASRGFHAANVPLIPNQPPPTELLRISSRRVIGLTMNAAHLESIRQTRLDRISHRPVAGYADLRNIQSELRQIRELMARKHWECIDVSYKATEEVADLIIEMLPGRRKPKSSHTKRSKT